MDELVLLLSLPSVRVAKKRELVKWLLPRAQAMWDDICNAMAVHGQVRKTPSWPRSWANFSLLWLYSY
jgi:hypothetical protein